MPEGTWELCCHPAYEDARWRALGSRPGAAQHELELFASPELREHVQAIGIELISYADLKPETRRAAA